MYVVLHNNGAQADDAYCCKPDRLYPSGIMANADETVAIGSFFGGDPGAVVQLDVLYF